MVGRTKQTATQLVEPQRQKHNFPEVRADFLSRRCAPLAGARSVPGATKEAPPGDLSAHPRRFARTSEHLLKRSFFFFIDVMRSRCTPASRRSKGTKALSKY
ncbi:unnamed protein product [Prorocentrum cordatum]|uniref:Uncharacterized protein n=1 Tax=Prorocentrum cordatum TaxID=2364126 RepID=A0ABN9SYR7_9DINO|nr:unnamed protein product [Polarella glacialis]